MSVNHLYLLAVAAIIGCASSNPEDPPGGKPAPIRTSFLTAEEIANTHADLNTAYDAILRLRANWLAPRGSMSSSTTMSYANVFVDGQFQGDVNALRNIPAYYVAEIRYYDVTQAGARYGVRAGTSGAIEVSMKNP